MKFYLLLALFYIVEYVVFLTTDYVPENLIIGSLYIIIILLLLQVAFYRSKEAK